MKKYILGLITSALLIASMAEGQGGAGFYIRSSCSSISNPVTGQTFCWEYGSNSLKYWDGSVFATVNNPIDQLVLDSTNKDVILLRDAANTLALRNGTNAQTSRIYNTFTNASNYERLNIGYVSNLVTIEHAAAGTGVFNRGFVFKSNGGQSYFGLNQQGGFVNVNTSGHLVFGVDNNNDIGTSGAVRPRDIYVGGPAVNGAVTIGSGGKLTSNALTNGQMLIGSTGASPVAAIITASSGISVTGGAGSLALTGPAAPTIQKFTANGTYTTPAGLRSALIWCIAGGGSGGGSNVATKNGGGGGAGEQTWRLVTAATLGSSQTVTIGAGGTNIAANTNTVGNAGGNSSIGAVLTCVGGNGGTQGGSGGNGGAGGVGGSNADVNISGAPGQPGSDSAATIALLSTGGGPCGGLFGASGQLNCGGGGGGGGTGLGSGSGGSGRIVVFEYY